MQARKCEDVVESRVGKLESKRRRVENSKSFVSLRSSFQLSRSITDLIDYCGRRSIELQEAKESERKERQKERGQRKRQSFHVLRASIFPREVATSNGPRAFVKAYHSAPSSASQSLLDETKPRFEVLAFHLLLFL